MASLEDQVFYDLLTYYKLNASLHVHSGHPPSGKTYLFSQVRIPNRASASRITRHHLDYIFQIGPILVLQELKGRASELDSDVLKLRSILDTYSLDELKTLLSRRIPNPNILDSVQHVATSVGFACADKKLPSDFLQFVVQHGAIKVIIGAALPGAVRNLLTSAFASSVSG